MTAVSSSDAFAATLAPEDVSGAPTLADTSAEREVPRRTAQTLSRTSTVLPRVEAEGTDVRLVPEGRPRYETARVLGEGGMGVVALAHDHDIDRQVAVKQIRREAGSRGVARFVEEVRTIGRLEHPNIIPIHDVGVDEEGNYFFVMKYVEGETIERIVERLAAGDEDAHRRYTFEARVHIFLGLLRALAYAHDRGIIHRDIKPANVMVGRYGEVVLMDWGIAKPVGSPDLPLLPDTQTDAAPAGETRRRLVQTAAQSLIGTPAYMSPEQARGESDLDPRSDLYSAAILFHELLTLGHYLADATTVPGMLVGVMQKELPPVGQLQAWAHPTQGLPPVELLHFLKRATRKDREARWGSAREMIGELEAALEGKVRVQCPMTFTKRMARESGRFVDRHPLGAFCLMVSAAALTVTGFAAGVVGLAVALS